MNLYSRKQRIKAALLIFALIIVGLSLWYSNFIVGKIQEDERQKVQLWSEAVTKRLALVEYTRKLFADLRTEERNKVRLYARATERIPIADDGELGLLVQITTTNTTVPVIVTDVKGKVTASRNVEDGILKSPKKLDSLLQVMRKTYPPLEVEIYRGTKQYFYYKDSRLITELEHTLDDIINSFISETVLNSASVPVILVDSTRQQVIRFGNIEEEEIDSPELLAKRLVVMEASNQPIRVRLRSDETLLLFYEHSTVITQLRYYPYVQILIIGLFLFIAYLIFSTFRNAEQNRVWIGLAKETAHQLGTPLSSLMAWIQLLEARGMDKDTLSELNKDVQRLETITDRFSKIGSKPELEEVILEEVIEEAIGYLQPRVSSKVQFEMIPGSETGTRIPINRPLFSWVMENLGKNAIDAMGGEGKISIRITDDIQNVFLDFSDTGKGIPVSSQKAIFEPGYTTKKRGWGLGLSLVKRIIENYHNGKIFVKRSEAHKGTTFRIVLRKRRRK